MSESFLRLTERIRRECVELERVTVRVREGWKRAQQTQDDFYIDSVALNLHSFYSGLERVFELIAATIDRKVPGESNWHRELLDQMAAEVPRVRPAVISEKVRDGLDEYRGFRHIVRNIYTFHFDSSKLEKIVERLPGVYTLTRTELLSFAEFLAQQAAEDL